MPAAKQSQSADRESPADFAGQSQSDVPNQVISSSAGFN
jgi:hypothetical protein